MKTSLTLFILSLFSLFGCNNQFTSINYKRNKSSDSLFKNISYSMRIPHNYKMITLIGGENELEKQYVYSDSSKLYISDFGSSTLNDNNIQSLGDSISKKRFEGIELKTKIAKQLGKEYQPETITLQGKTAGGLYWKDIRVGYLSIGYVNVPQNKKNEFDKTLTSFH